MESIEITDRGASQIARGMLWVFSNEIYKKPASLAPGSWCTFHCRSKMIATGYANPHSLIFGRVVALGEDSNQRELLKRRLSTAFARRRLKPGQAARLVYSEADFLPGLIIDAYADHVVLQSNTAGMDLALPLIESLVPELYKSTFGHPLKTFLVKADSSIRRLEQVDDFKRIVMGKESDFEDLMFEEEGTKFAIDILNGQKTGFFLDQKNNRSFAAQAVQEGNKRVLDLCCYSGGWGLRALQAGADHVTFVDESDGALKLLQRGLTLNKFAESKARLVRSDVFEFLEKDSAQYDLIVADPPAFVKSKKNLPQAIKGYEKLNRFAWRHLKPGGVLVSCSCSYHLSDLDFLQLLQEAVGKEKGLAHLIYRGLQATDHPILLSMPETHYLKCVALRKIDVVSN